MGIIQAHGLYNNQTSSYNSINSLKHFSIAEYHFVKGKEPMGEYCHKHKEYEFLIPLRTIPLLEYDDACYIGEVGYIYPVNPSVAHGISCPADKSAFINITVDNKVIDDLKKQLGCEEKTFSSRFIMPRSFLGLIAKYQREFAKEKADKALLEEIAKSIVLCLVKSGLSLKVEARRPHRIYRKNIKQMVMYMYNNFQNEDLDIADLAELSGYSVAYFTKAFKAYMHVTPVVHLNKLRISEAKSMMYAGSVSFSNIYKKVGYRNLSSFTEAFKRVTGITPSAYKESYLKA